MTRGKIRDNLMSFWLNLDGTKNYCMPFKRHTSPDCDHLKNDELPGPQRAVLARMSIHVYFPKTLGAAYLLIEKVVDHARRS